MSKKANTPKQNTLFNYFSKSPKNLTPNHNKNDGLSSSPVTGKNQSKSNDNLNKHKGGSDSKNHSSPSTSKRSVEIDDEGSPYEAYDLVWAKLEGYPWWPSIVCDHPTAGTYIKKNKGKTTHIHVQFFDDPVSRSWIRLRDIKDYNGKFNSDVPLLKDPKWNMAIDWCEEAKRMQKNERWKLIADLMPSDDEQNDEQFEESIEEAKKISKETFDNSNNSVEKQKSPVNKSKTDKSNDDSFLKRKNLDKRESLSKRKRMRFEESSEESEDEYKPSKSDDEESDSFVEEDLIADEEVEVDEDDSDSSEVEVKKKSNKRDKTPAQNKTKNKSSNKKFEKDDNDHNGLGEESFVSTKELPVNDSSKTWPHLEFDFLKPNNIMDINKRKKDDPDYDSKTLFVPQKFLVKQTPGHKQWWELKSKHFDTILCFKVGKFYELFHMDAVIGMNELQLTPMTGAIAHAGFPERSYQFHAKNLVQRGYKVARIEQIETPRMMEERCKKKLTKTGKDDKVVMREICRITTIGTRTCSVHDVNEPETAENQFLLAITEKTRDRTTEFGVCFIDTSIGKFYVGQFADDQQCSRLRTLLAHNIFVEMILDKKNISDRTKQVINNAAPKALLENVSKFCNSFDTLKILKEGDYFDQDSNSLQWPTTLMQMLSSGNILNPEVKSEYELAIGSFGSVINYLKDCLIDQELLSMKLVEEYKPNDLQIDFVDKEIDQLESKFMILDSVTLKNLEIFENSSGDKKGSLFEVLDYCSTSFGKRLLRQWMCSPPVQISTIVKRQEAVNDLCNGDLRSEIFNICAKLKKLPDLERLLSKIHVQGNAKRSKNHPDSRAIFFDAQVYSKKKITDFILVLKGFEDSNNIIEQFQKNISNLKSSVLNEILTFQQDGGKFPNLKPKLDFFNKAFDHEKAKQDGKIIPKIGVDQDYDKAISLIKSIEKKFQDYKEEQRKFFNCKIDYFGSGKNRYQLEVPEFAVKKVTDKYELQTSRKGFKRYWTPTIKQWLQELTQAEETKETVLQDIMRRIFQKFDSDYNVWLQAIQCLSLFDVFISLFLYRDSLLPKGIQVCQPKFVSSSVPFIDVVNSRHPCLIKYCDNFIPNDFKNESQLCLLTGPNMGGKSTLMRQIGLLTIMAHLGSYIPAEQCTLTPVDRIFTRIGASDRITEGESTFYIELNETAIILKHATKHSLVLIDELGRGTATFDGTAIASSVVSELCTNIKCKTLFSTHYYSLVDEFSSYPSVQIKHMACVVENENDEDPTQECITFLYKLKDGSCPKSYGFNAARLAGIPQDIVRAGFTKSKQFEKKNEVRKIIRRLLCSNLDDEQFQNDISSLKKFYS